MRIPKLKLQSCIALAIAGVLATSVASASTYVYRIASPGLKATIPEPHWVVTGAPSLDFSSAYIGNFAEPDLTISIKNTGGGSGSLSLPAFTGTNPSDFSTTDNCTSIAPTATCSVTVKFKPLATGSRVASLAVGATVLNFTGDGAAVAPSNFNATSTGAYGTIQSWTVHTTGTYTVTFAGAAGGATTNGVQSPGLGAVVTSRMPLVAGTVLNILVGQRGSTSENSRTGGGGGGTFIVSSGALLAAAGGGGGANTMGGSFNGYNASLTTAETGRTGTGWPNGGGGSGFSANGFNDYTAPYMSGGQSYSYANGGTGGGTIGEMSNPSLATLKAPGGFGGGGGGGWNGGGSGGGYSAQASGGGAGGTSYYRGTFVSSTATNSGAGYVTFTLD